MRIFLVPLAVALFLAACTTPPVTPSVGPDGRPAPRVYDIGAGDKDKIQFRMLDAVNVLRSQNGLAPLQFDSALNAAAATHARDMSRQNRPWHFGSDGSSPIDRVRRAGFDGRMLGENISETYETELQTLAAWMEVPATRTVIMEPRARRLGFEWFQEPNGKIWWTMVTGT